MKHFLSLLAVAALLYACQKEVSSAESLKTVQVSLPQFFKNNTAPIHRFTATASDFISFTTAKGTDVQFPDNAFVTLNNVPVTGAVEIEIKEIFTPGEMILNNTPTMSNGAPLVSGGEFFVRARQNNEVLKLAPGKYIRISVRPPVGADMEGMQVFNGDTSTGTLNWILNSNQGNVVTRDSGLSYVSLFADSLQWLNIDKLIDEPQITYTVNPGNTPNVDSTAIFVHLTGRKSVFSFPAGANSFTSDNLIAARATLVGICVVDGKLYYAMQPVVMQNGGSATLTFTQIEEDALKQKLATLE
jgi:hypothetical protein